MENFNAPFRFDYVGSFLRPEHLKQARADFEAGKITKAELESIENEAITDLIKKQKAAGYPVITDGEFRRSYWHLDFMWGLEGIEHIELDHGYFFHGEETTHGSVRVTGKISGEQHPFVEHFKFVKQFEDEHTIARQTIPAPAQLLAELFREDNGTQTLAVYPDLEELIQDIAQAYRTVIRDLYDAGCRNIQFDDCTWGMFCDKNYWEARQKDFVSLEEEALWKMHLKILCSQPMYAAEIIIPPGHPPADMNRSRRFFLPMKMYLPIIWNLMMNAPEDLNHSALFPMIKKSYLAL